MGERRFAVVRKPVWGYVRPIPTKFVVSAKRKLSSQQKVSLPGSITLIVFMSSL